MSRHLSSVSLLILLLFLISLNTSKAQSPNVVIVFVDDMGYGDLACFGSPDIETPNLDQMAREGVRFTNFYAAQPICSASRAALLTGCYPNRIGVHQALMPDSPTGLNPDETTIAEMLKKKGYATAIFGKWHLGDTPNLMPNRQGFDEYFGIPYSNDMWPHHPQQGSVFHFGPLPLYENEQIIDTLDDQSLLTTQITQHSVDFILKNKNNPFFLYVAHPQPHVPLFVSDKFKGKSKHGLYGDVVMELDWSVGQILQTLKDANLDRKTLVIFTSDNGPWLSYGTHAGSAGPLREGKGTVWEGGQREPFIARFPGTIPDHRVVDTPVMTIDILPTIAELTGAALPEKTIDGKSALGVLTGKDKTSPHQAYFYYYRINELHAVRYGRWKMYFPHTYRSLNGRPGGTGGNPVPYDHNTVDQIELYDLVTDPSETTDIAAAHPEIIAEIKKLADEKRTELGDKLQGIEGKENRAPGRASGMP